MCETSDAIDGSPDFKCLHLHSLTGVTIQTKGEFHTEKGLRDCKTLAAAVYVFQALLKILQYHCPQSTSILQRLDKYVSSRLTCS